MNVDQLDRRIEDIEKELLRNDPTLDQQFAQLDPVYKLHDAIVLTLLAASAVFLMIGLSTMSIAAWLAGAISVVTAFTVDTRHERELRAALRAAELGLSPRRDNRNRASSDRGHDAPNIGRRQQAVATPPASTSHS